MSGATGVERRDEFGPTGGRKLSEELAMGEFVTGEFTMGSPRGVNSRWMNSRLVTSEFEIAGREIQVRKQSQQGRGVETMDAGDEGERGRIREGRRKG